jgi:hypothetical protein
MNKNATAVIMSLKYDVSMRTFGILKADVDKAQRQIKKSFDNYDDKARGIKNAEQYSANPSEIKEAKMLHDAANDNLIFDMTHAYRSVVLAELLDRALNAEISTDILLPLISKEADKTMALKAWEMLASKDLGPELLESLILGDKLHLDVISRLHEAPGLSAVSSFAMAMFIATAIADPDQKEFNDKALEYGVERAIEWVTIMQIKKPGLHDKHRKFLFEQITRRNEALAKALDERYDEFEMDVAMLTSGELDRINDQLGKELKALDHEAALNEAAAIAAEEAAEKAKQEKLAATEDQVPAPEAGNGQGDAGTPAEKAPDKPSA